MEFLRATPYEPYAESSVIILPVGTLYLISTPIGNLKDITRRALETLKSVEFIACEDTRRTGLLLKLLSQEYSVSNRITPAQLISYHEHNELQRIPQILTALLNDQNVALVSDAGTPTISDPGFKLVRECRKQGISVVSIPGVSAFLSALTVSGLPTDKFMFVGYLPHKEGKRLTLLKKIQETLALVNQTVILYEAPHKLVTTLENLQEVFGNIEVVLARELTKMHEEVQTFLIKDAIDVYSSKTPRGEFVVLFHPDSSD